MLEYLFVISVDFVVKYIYYLLHTHWLPLRIKAPPLWSTLEREKRKKDPYNR